MTRREALEYIEANTIGGWLSRDSSDCTAEVEAALIPLLGSHQAAGYMSDASGWRVHARADSFEDNERRLARVIRDLAE